MTLTKSVEIDKIRPGHGGQSPVELRKRLQQARPRSQSSFLAARKLAAAVAGIINVANQPGGRRIKHLQPFPKAPIALHEIVKPLGLGWKIQSQQIIAAYAQKTGLAARGARQLRQLG